MLKLMQKTNLWRGLTAVFAVLLAVAIYLTSLLYDWEGLVNIALDVKVPTVEASGDTVYYPTGYEMSDKGLADMLADSDKHDVQTMEEGAVLLKNDGNALPLASTERKVTLFGRAVADPLYKGRSGGVTYVDTADATTLAEGKPQKTTSTKQKRNTPLRLTLRRKLSRVV